MSDTSPGTTRLADVTLGELRRALVTVALLLTALYLFLGMVGSVFLAGILGVVIGIYLIPLSDWLADRLGSASLAALLSIGLLLLPVLAVVIYGYTELERALDYVTNNTDAVAGEVRAAVERLPIVPALGESTIQDGLESLAAMKAEAPAAIQGLLGRLLVAIAIFLFTAFYVITETDQIVDYLRGSVPPRYASLTETLESNARGVLYGTIFAVLLTQGLKALTLLVLFVLFGVPLPVTLAVVAFFVGLFPVVGSWTIYIPAAGYLLIFENEPARALGLVVIAFLISTPLLSLYVRPKLAAERSGVLNFYWMLLGLVAGVYAFGVPGVIVGPLLIGLLKATLDTIRASESWQTGGRADHDEPEPEVMAEEKLEEE
jgi:predicted PurR-regulated permease PerM